MAEDFKSNNNEEFETRAFGVNGFPEDTPENENREEITADSGKAADEPFPLPDERVTGPLADEIPETKEPVPPKGPVAERRDYHPVRRRRDGKTGCLGGVMYAVFIISVSVILACMAWLFASDVLALNKPVSEAVVTIPKGFDVDDVADALKDGGLIEYKFLFKMYAGISHAEEKINPGSYNLSTIYDYRALVKKMQTGSESQLVTKVTIPEGYTMQQIFQKLEENNVCSVEDLEKAAANYSYNYSFIKDLEKGDPSRLEGFLFPDTYDFYEGEQASSVINKFLVNFYYKLTADMLKQAENLNMTMKEIVTVASMIEKETAEASERALIASVIYNRLNNGIPLQIDATVQYALPERKAYLTTDDLAVDSPYNTYLYTGLPAGAICNPSLASINAALQPETTNYFFYALDTETGLHKFFKTAGEHEAFVTTQDYTAQ